MSTRGNRRKWPLLKRAYGEACLRCQKREATTLNCVTPLGEGGSKALANLQQLCAICHEFDQQHDALGVRSKHADYRPRLWRDRLADVLSRQVREQIQPDTFTPRFLKPGCYLCNFTTPTRDGVHMSGPDGAPCAVPCLNRKARAA